MLSVHRRPYKNPTMSSKAPSRSEPSSQGRSPIQARGGAPAPAPARPRRIVLRILTRAQDISALALGSFLVVHLAAPLSALVVGQGAETASKTMVSYIAGVGRRARRSLGWWGVGLDLRGRLGRSKEQGARMGYTRPVLFFSEL